LNEELALTDLELAYLEFYGQNEKFMGWFSKVRGGYFKIARLCPSMVEEL